MCHFDLRRQATAVIAAKPASALLCDTAMWCVVRVWGVWGGVLGWDERCDGFKNMFSTSRSDRKIQSNRSSQKLFRDCVRSPIWASVENGRFQLTDPTALRIGLA